MKNLFGKVTCIHAAKGFSVTVLGVVMNVIEEHSTILVIDMMRHRDVRWPIAPAVAGPFTLQMDQNNSLTS